MLRMGAKGCGLLSSRVNAEAEWIYTPSPPPKKKQCIASAVFILNGTRSTFVDLLQRGRVAEA
jgi:hypothetical protein